MANAFETPGDSGPFHPQFDGSGHPDDWDRMIRNLAIWGLAILAFLCGLVATLTLFGTQSQMTFLAERTAQLTGLISRTNEIDKRVGALSQEVRSIQRKGEDAAVETGKVERIESSISTLSQTVGALSTDVHATKAKIEDKIGVYDSEISQMELRLSKTEKSARAEKIDGLDDVFPPVFSPPAPLVARRKNPIRYFSVIRIARDSALIAGPQGWFHVEVGSLLPGGAKIVDIVKRNNHSVVLTDQGPIKRAR